MTRGTGVIEETPWWLEVNGRRVAAGTVRPPRVREMAAGRLRADGWVRSADEIEALEVEVRGGCVGIRARVPDRRLAEGLAERAHREEAGCGPLHVVRCDPGAVRHARSGPMPDLAVFPALFRELFAAAGRASPVGGIHVAALVDAGGLVEPCDDVSRHNAVDKAIGAAFLAGHDVRTLGLVVTARVSGEMAQKAARCGVAWLASRSLPTTIAVTVAETAGMPLIARAPAPDATVYGVGGARERAS